MGTRKKPDRGTVAFEATTVLAILFAAAAAAVFAIATVIQHRSASAVPAGHVSAFQLTLRLAKQPRWLIGKGADFVAFALQALALSRGSFIVVQSVLASGVVLALIIEARLDHHFPSPATLIGSCVVLLGVVLIVGVGQPHGGRPAPPPMLYFVVATLLAAAVAGAIVYTRHHVGQTVAILLGVGGGICFSMAAAFVRTGGRRLTQDGLCAGFFASAFGFVVFGVLGNVLVQRAFQLGSLRIVLPSLTAIEPLTALAIGHVLFDERLHKTIAGRLGGYGGMALLACGVVITQLQEATLAASPAKVPT